MCEALEDHEGSVSIGGRLITNFRFADDIVVNAEEEEEVGVLVDRLDTTITRYKMEIGTDKTKVLFVLRLNVPVNNFSVMSGRSHRFLGN